MLAKIRDMLAQHPSLSARLETERETFERNRQTALETSYHLFTNEFGRLLDRSYYDEALALVDQFEQENSSHPKISELKSLRDKVKTEAVKKVGEYEKKIKDLLASHRYGAALSACKDYPNEIHYRKEDGRFITQGDKILNNLDKLFSPVREKVLALVQQWQYEKASLEVNKEKTKFFGTPLTAKVDELEATVKGFRNLHTNVLDQINKSDPWPVPKEFGIKKLNGKTIQSATKKEIKVTLGPGGGTSYDWESFDPADIAKIYAHYVRENNKDDMKYLELFRTLFCK